MECQPSASAMRIQHPRSNARVDWEASLLETKSSGPSTGHHSTETARTSRAWLQRVAIFTLGSEDPAWTGMRSSCGYLKAHCSPMTARSQLNPSDAAQADTARRRTVCDSAWRGNWVFATSLLRRAGSSSLPALPPMLMVPPTSSSGMERWPRRRTGEESLRPLFHIDRAAKGGELDTPRIYRKRRSLSSPHHVRRGEKRRANLCRGSEHQRVTGGPARWR